jgi:hypothetical protein
MTRFARSSVTAWVATFVLGCSAGTARPTASGGTTAGPAASIALAHRPPAVGTTVTTHGTKTEETEGTLAAEGHEQASSTKAREDQERSEEVLAITDGRASKVKVTYKARSLSAEENGQREDATAPVVGKSYVVTRDGPNVVVDGGDGQSVAAEEVAIVAKDF